jgi:DNA polymerase III subunit epsilon
MLPSYVVLDLETTGGSASADSVTEIAAVRIDNGQETERWSTLVNPGVPIPGFIVALTGISDAMVADAPRFKQVADKLLSLLDGSVLVAHNASFDHGFLRSEYARLGHDLQVPSLCTVRLSRKLYPQFRSHGLDALMQRHGLHTKARHRAMGDVDMVLAWLAQAQGEFGADHLRQIAAEILQAPQRLPARLETPMEDIPVSPGVYLLYGEAPAPLYIGSAGNLRQRVVAHLQSAPRTARDRGIVNNTQRVEWRQTAGEIGALLLAKSMATALKPTHGGSKQAAQPDFRALYPWPHKGPIGLREHNPDSDRSELHVFQDWCHLATLSSEPELEAVLDSLREGGIGSGFDLDVYRLLVKRLLSASRNSASLVYFPPFANTPTHARAGADGP